MSQIQKFDKANLQTMRQAINAALAQVTKEYGVELSIGNISYSPDGFEFSTKLSAKIKNDASSQAAIDKQNMWLRLYGLKIGDKLKIGNKEYAIVGFDEKKRAKPVVVQEPGKNERFVLPTDDAKKWKQ